MGKSYQLCRLTADRKRHVRRAALALSCLLLGSSVNTAVAQTWTNTSADGLWGTANNWNPAAEPIATSNVILPAGLAGTINLVTGELANSLTINDAYTLAGGDLTLTGGAITNSGAVTISSILQGTAGVTKSGAGTLTLSGVNTYTGTTRITGGTLSIAADTGVGAVPAATTPGSIVIDGGELSTSAAFTLNTRRGIALGTSGTNRLTSLSGNLTYSGIITDAVLNTPAALTIAGGYVPGGQSTYSGGTTIVSGTTIPTASSTGPAGAPTSGPFGTGLVDFTGGSIRSSSTPANGVTIGNPVRFSANTSVVSSGSLGNERDLRFTGPITLAAAVDASRTITVSINAGNGNAAYLNGAIGATNTGVGLIKAGSGIMYLGGANTYTGATTISAGTLVVSGGSTTTSEFIFGTSTNAILRVTNAAGLGSARLTAATGSVTSSFQFRLDGGGTTNLSNHFGINSSITSTIDVNNNGTGTDGIITLNPTTTGGLGIGNGIINVTGGNGYRLQFNNIRATAGAGTVRFNPTTANLTLVNVYGSNTSNHLFQLDGTSTDNQVTGVISNSITGTSGISSVSKTGTGTWIFSGSNTYTGTTTVSAGLLVVNGNQTTANGAVTVSGGTLGGTGTIGGATTIAAGATLAPGNSIGTLNLANSLSLTDGALFTYELAAPGNNDLVSMPSQTLNLNGQEFSDFTFVPQTGFGDGSYILFDAGTIAGSLGAATSGVISFGGTDYNATLALDVPNNNVVLNVTTVAIPEPSTLVLAGLGCLGFAGLQLRRKRSKAE